MKGSAAESRRACSSAVAGVAAEASGVMLVLEGREMSGFAVS
jgi:hypothetical protein